MAIIHKVKLINPEFLGTKIWIDVPADSPTWAIGRVALSSLCTVGTVDWGDGTVDTFTDTTAAPEHTYEKEGRYVVTLGDNYKWMRLGESGDETFTAEHMPKVRRYFSNARRLNILSSGIFRGCVNLTEVEISTLKIENFLPYVFQDCSSLESLGDLPGTLKRLYFYSFKGCSKLKGRLDFPNVVYLSGAKEIFPGCPLLEEIHFAASAEQAIKLSEIYKSFPNLGAENATVYFDL